ncbi:F-box only protein 9 [Tribolium castaneum]|uniref:F-box only protein 9 n=1 Tax=Tribolium castaneum TaxID=7070 RepID=D6X4P0_TRICA|nr:PREDICTED: F-box only protein 9 [Tribolium castaneum]EEZ97671.2 F-box only protein 9-like Protein [Tribolium castaneum]|eukprot:XP_008199086.1 PREDICTED: F-box only protein 9 [Tribolium castaneum]
MSSLRNGSSESSSDSSTDGEDQDESSSSVTQGVEDVLSTFREKWQKELQISPPKREHQSQDTPQDPDAETQARRLFLKGVDLEKSGKLYESIQFYRRAVQLVPDIEFRIDKEEMHEKDEENSEGEHEVTREGELLQRIQKKLSKRPALCVPKTEQKGTHISVLPTEMILHILRWVVSAELDLRSLEMFSMVCRGFYLCARDPEVWRLACLRVWGLNCGNSPYNYLSWRHMFIERTRLHFNGCYIGKTTYIRHGENNFQDQFYRPWHLVAYYRYLRFFPEGVVLVLTSSEEPAQCVSLMKSRNARSPILRGYYRLKDDKVTLVVQRQDNKHVPGFKKKRRGGDLREMAEQTFHMELQIKSTNKKRHVQLVWTHYSVFTRTHKGDESTCNFDLVGNRFPPFWFSRVKSYTSESDSPLQ